MVIFLLSKTILNIIVKDQSSHALGVSQHMHKKNCEIELNWSSKLRDKNGRKNTLVTWTRVLLIDAWFWDRGKLNERTHWMRSSLGRHRSAPVRSKSFDVIPRAHPGQPPIPCLLSGSVAHPSEHRRVDQGKLIERTHKRLNMWRLTSTDDWVRSISFPGSTLRCSLEWAPDKS